MTLYVVQTVAEDIFAATALGMATQSTVLTVGAGMAVSDVSAMLTGITGNVVLDTRSWLKPEYSDDPENHYDDAAKCLTELHERERLYIYVASGDQKVILLIDQLYPVKLGFISRWAVTLFQSRYPEQGCLSKHFVLRSKYGQSGLRVVGIKTNVASFENPDDLFILS